MQNTEKIFPPSKFIKDELTKRGLTQTDLALITGRYQSEISGYLSKEKVSIEFAKELALVLGNTPEYWLSLENKYRLSQTEELNESVVKRNSFIQDYPLKDMQKRGWISKTDDFELLANELENFFEMTVESKKLENNVSFKRTLTEQELNPAEKAWLYRAKHLAKILPVSKYDDARFDLLLQQLRKAVKSSKAVHKIAELLQKFGIRFVIVEHLPKSKIDGAAFWLDENSPVVALSLRFDNIGSFWFALIHELIHIKYRDAFSLDNLDDSPTNEIEQRANTEAAEFLVNQETLQKFIELCSPYFSSHKINEFATRLQVHPGVIVGQLQHRKFIGYNTHRASMAKVRELATMTAFTDGWGHPVPQVKF